MMNRFAFFIRIICFFIKPIGCILNRISLFIFLWRTDLFFYFSSRLNALANNRFQFTHHFCLYHTHNLKAVLQDRDDSALLTVIQFF